MRSVAAKILLWIGCSMGAAGSVAAAIPSPDSPRAREEAKDLDRLPPVAPSGKAPIDHSGRKQKGHASYYAPKFAQRKMADGNRMNLQTHVAASKTLPLGTTASVVNLQTGKAAVVQVQDRGPFAAGRVMDVTPKVAQELAMTNRGVVPVEVKPIAVPQPNGDVKLGAGAADLTPQQIREATSTTQSLAHGNRTR
jgi:rare lipoprotein A